MNTSDLLSSFIYVIEGTKLKQRTKTIVDTLEDQKSSQLAIFQLIMYLKRKGRKSIKFLIIY